ncbi:uncharacterized protein Z520_07054 [Fonsecaea multimorphosa CBS 102226]|uniref:Uncharacterized protein n=1 Tax=Fonsecaea multimorphosa CBS 102226 TaxID=1442371 RepID=A0A0D2H553_9EURO|nr:uncharacterized protein Z520_07054 [Fonsecaea multimorphosa CBS 102226]KIX96940.1 hypothetical protein Z520_07054 [Fonsecaea multimorphosa CBS 102226]OAL23137.1 hypothetical protein AYO22_06630 [Fonsecaea multimorphosa]
MSFTTETVTEITTTAVVISPTVISDITTTVTCHISTTLFATFGQTVTIPSPASPSTTTVTAPTTKYTPIPTITTQTSTVTLTELDIYLQDDGGNIYSTWIIPISGFPLPNSTHTGDPGQLIYVVDPHDGGGWDHWSTGAKAGMIVGVVLGAIVILAMTFWCVRKRVNGKWWFAHAWPHSGAAPPVVDIGGPTLVHGSIVNGHSVPYQYGYGYGYGVGLRGGGGDRSSRPRWARKWLQG